MDAVINHMTGGGSGVGSNGSYFDGDKEDFPGVPFSAWDFHGRDVCYTHDLEVHDYNNAQEVRKRVSFKVVRIFQLSYYITGSENIVSKEIIHWISQTPNEITLTPWWLVLYCKKFIIISKYSWLFTCLS